MFFQPQSTKSDDLARAAAEKIKVESGANSHDIGVIVGSGWAGASEFIGSEVMALPAEELPGFSKSSVPGHNGILKSMKLPNGKRVILVGARVHLYEGKGVQAVAHPVRTIAASGAKTIVLTNGAGGIKKSWAPGTPVLITDHINLTATSPLDGAAFIDLTDLYSTRLQAIAQFVDPNLDGGVYVQFRGPHYETPAEVQMARAMGGHIIGMSTALEAIAAREAGMEILGLSLITNLAAGISSRPLSHQEVMEAGKAAEPVISELLAKIVRAL